MSLKSIIKQITIFSIILCSFSSYCQQKYRYEDKYKYKISETGNVFTFGYLYYPQFNTQEISINAGNFHIYYWNLNIFGMSLFQLEENWNLSFYTGPWGLNKPIYCGEKLNILGNINITPRLMLLSHKEDYGSKIICPIDLSISLETSYISFDIGYTLTDKNPSVKLEGEDDDYDTYSYKYNFNNPYFGFFIRANILIGDGIKNEYKYVGRKKIKLPNPDLNINYSFTKKQLEAGEKVNIIVNAINSGKGNAESVWLKINSTSSDLISLQSSNYVGNILPKSSKNISIPLVIQENIFEKKYVQVTLSLEEKDGFKATKQLSFNVIPKKPIYPASLYIPKNSILFNDNNGVLESGEKANIIFKLSNKGKGSAVGMLLKISAQNIDGINIEKERNIGNLESGKEIDISIPIQTNYNTKDGICKLVITIEEANGFNSDPVVIEIPTSKFQQPNILVTDYIIQTSNNQLPKLGEPISLKFSIQNIGQSSATDIFINCLAPNNIFFSTTKNFKLEELKPNELKIFEVELFANKLYSENEIPVTIDIKESFGKYAVSKVANINLNSDKSTTKISLDGQLTVQDIKISGIRSDIDINIPENKTISPNTYALIIGNEDYSSKQNNLNKEIDVIFAKNDAIIFKSYLTKVYGVPEKNINLILNATAAEIKQSLDKLGKIASLVGKKSDFIIFYAGHGISNNITSEPYIIPVDVNASNLDYAIKLNEFTSIFNKNEVKQATIILDACFSGFGRNQNLIETRGVRIEPKYSSFSKNTILISSSSSVEPSHPYNEKSHGLFTYYLLKKIQETKGNVNLKDLYEFVNENVTIQSVLIKNMQQTPKIITGKDFSGNLDRVKLVNEK